MLTKVTLVKMRKKSVFAELDLTFSFFSACKLMQQPKIAETKQPKKNATRPANSHSKYLEARDNPIHGGAKISAYASALTSQSSCCSSEIREFK